jgi:hypothetical protein
MEKRESDRGTAKMSKEMLSQVADSLCLKAQDEIIPLHPHEAVAMLTHGAYLKRFNRLVASRDATASGATKEALTREILAATHTHWQRELRLIEEMEATATSLPQLDGPQVERLELLETLKQFRKTVESLQEYVQPLESDKLSDESLGTSRIAAIQESFHAIADMELKALRASLKAMRVHGAAAVTIKNFERREEKLKQRLEVFYGSEAS